MALPTSREQLKEYCLRRLGSPTIDINVDEEQIQDRIDDAIQYFREYHFDGTEHTYLKHQITDIDITNKYIDIPSNISGITRIFDVGESHNSTNSLFNVRYQLSLNELYSFSSADFAPYVMTKRHLETIEEIFVGHQPIRFNRHTNKLYVDMDWDRVTAGNYLIVDCYAVLDPDTYTDMWGDRWILRYCTALFKRQWGENLSKFGGIQLPGGITLDGVRILNDANAEIEKLENEMINSYSLPVYDMIG